MKLKKLLIALTLICNNLIFAQLGLDHPYDPGNVIGEQLETQIISVFGEQYSYRYYVLDSMFNKDYVYAEIIDPYNQLQGKVLFIAYPFYDSEHLHPPYYETYYSKPDSSIIGIFANGTIIWHSEPISLVKTDTARFGQYHYYSIPDEIFAIKDINRDGKVDILLMTDALWIISWDGNTGAIINDVDPIDRSSKLLSSDAYLLIFTNNDNIYEILSYWFDYDSTYSKFPPINIPTRPYVTYGWNGEKYGLWDDVVQIGLNEFPIANKLTGKVNCKVEFRPNDDSSYFYNYIISNDETSAQNIHNFILDNITEDKNVYAPYGQWSNKVFDSSGVFWGEIMGSSVVQPGKEKGGFLIKSRKLPNITKFYLQAEGTRIAYTIDLAKPYDPLSVINNIRTNSYSGYIIAPIDPPDSLILLNFLDTLLNYNQRSFELGWITNQPTSNKYANYFTTAKTQLQQNNIAAVKNTLQTVLQEVNQDSSGNLSSEAYALLRYNTEYLLENLPEEESGLNIKLINSTGTLLTGGSLQYYQNGWKDAINNRDGTFKVITEQPSVSLRMTYEYGTQTVSNVPTQNNTYTFQTVNTIVKIQDSQGNQIDTGRVQYYANGWREFGTTTNGVVTKELLPNNYSFRMTYAYASNDKQQNIGTNPTVVFQTVNAVVQLQNSQGNLIDQGIVQYYANGWREFGITTNGVVTKELLPNNYSFRMTYAYASNDKQQNIGTNPTVVFQTVNAMVQLQNRQGNFIDQGTVQYYANGWREFGTTTNGVVTKELLPKSYSFRMTHDFISNDKQQDIGVSSTVTFSTVLCRIKVTNTQNQPVDGALIKYYSGGWRDIGATVNGEVTKEILPKSLSFRVNYNGQQIDKTQDISANSTIEFIIQP